MWKSIENYIIFRMPLIAFHVWYPEMKKGGLQKKTKLDVDSRHIHMHMGFMLWMWVCVLLSAWQLCAMTIKPTSLISLVAYNHSSLSLKPHSSLRLLRCGMFSVSVEVFSGSSLREPMVKCEGEVIDVRFADTICVMTCF